MPELPEVETTLRGLEPHIINKKIEQIIVRQSQLRWKVPVFKLEQNLVGNIFTSIKRRAKYLILNLDKGSLIIHLGMSGTLRLVDKKTETEKHDHIDILFKENLVLRYTDPRRFGSFVWAQDPLDHKLIKNLGPEPLGNEFNANYLFEISKNRTLAIKNLIMDSKVVAGIGNIYASEALFEAGIKPNRESKKVRIEEFESLVLTTRKLLNKSIKKGGTTLRDFVGGDSKPGYFKQQLSVYGRAGKPCMKCKNTLQSLKIGQRSSVFCKECQK
tara:strand:+ start:2491 stop:3306 length:816 start_codon:yes stop_codon:yes gene_type:complete